MPEARNIEARSSSLQNLVADVAGGKYRIPRFQRDYVWPPKKVLELFDSIYKEYPIGSFFLWKAGKGQSALFRQSGALGVPPVRDEDDVTYILDGQQRITSLYATLKGLTIGNNDYSAICFDLVDERFVVRNVESRVRYIPVRDIWGGQVMSVGRNLEQDLFDRLNRLYTRLMNYPISIVEVQDKGLADVCGIFQRINQSGKRLDRFDLITAMTFTDDFDLRERFQEDLLTPLKESGFGEISPTSTTQLLALIAKGACTEKNEFDLSTEDVRSNWQRCVDGFQLAADLLRKNMGVMEARYLPYEAMLTLAAYFFVISDRKQPDAKQLEWLKRWFWRSTFGTRYGSAVASTMSRDRELLDLLQEGDEPRFNQRLELEIEDLIKTRMTSTRSAIRNGFLCLLAVQRPVNLSQNAELDLTGVTISSLTEKQKHHIFPWAFLRKHVSSSANVHALPNFCFLPADLNNHISAKAPSNYFDALAKENSDFEAALRKSLIPDPARSGILDDDYTAFLQARARLILDEVQRLCGQLDKPREGSRSTRLNTIEHALRDLIHERLSHATGELYWKQAIPSDVRERAEALAVNEWGELGSARREPRKLLDFCNTGEYKKIIGTKANWQHFEDVFGRRQDFEHHFLKFTDLRNHVAHNRPIEGLALAEGETAIVWFESVLPAIQDPAQAMEEEIAEEDFDDDSELVPEDPSSHSRAYWENRLSRKLLKLTDALIEVVVSALPGAVPQYRSDYIAMVHPDVPAYFVLLFPRSSWVRFAARLPYSTDDVDRIELAGLDMMPYNPKRGRVRIRIRPDDLEVAEAVVVSLVQQSYKYCLEKPNQTREKFEWDEQSFMARLEEQDGPEEREIAQALLKMSKQRADQIGWNKTKPGGDARFNPRYLNGSDRYLTFFVRAGSGPGKASVELQFGEIMKYPGYEEEDARIELIRELNEIQGFDIPEDATEKYPKVPILIFKDPAVRDQFYGVIESVVDNIRRHAG